MNLVTQLQIGMTETRNSALDSVLNLLQEDDKNVMIAMAQGVVLVLVRLLDTSSSSEIKEKTVTAIAWVSTVDLSKHVLVAEGLLPLNILLRVLESGSGFAKEKVRVSLLALSQSKENARAIGFRCGISALLEIFQARMPSSQAFVAGVLRNLAAVKEKKKKWQQRHCRGFSFTPATDEFLERKRRECQRRSTSRPTRSKSRRFGSAPGALMP